MEYQNILERDDLVDGDVGEMGDCSVVELLVEQAEASAIGPRFLLFMIVWISHVRFATEWPMCLWVIT